MIASSDGLHGLVEDDELRLIIGETAGDLEKLADELVRAALDHGGNDNVTVVIVQYVGNEQ